LNVRVFAALALMSLTTPLWAKPKREAGNISLAPDSYPAEAEKKGVSGNVVLTGEITSEGKVTGLRVLASSSKLLDDAAVRHIARSKFSAGKEDGVPTVLLLNAVVRFRSDRAKPGETGTMPAPIVGNFAVMPAEADGRAAAPEGFSIERDDRGVRGELDIDVPKGSAAGKTFHVLVTDRFPSGKTIGVLDRTMRPEATGSSLGAIVFRPIDPTRREEQGIHTLSVSVDGANAGGARYLVASTAAPSVPRATSKKK
jgi:TonB family protein